MNRFLTPDPDPAAGPKPGELPPAFGDLVKRVDALTKELAEARANDADKKEIAALKAELAEVKKQLAAKPDPDEDADADDEPAPPKKKKSSTDSMCW